MAAAGGDREAFSSLLSRHYDGLFRLCFRLTGQQHIAEDITQDICLALPSKMRSYKGTAKFSTWLYRVAVNAVHDWRRRAHTRAKAADGWGDWEKNRRAETAEADEAMIWLQEAMKQLPAELQDTIALTVGEGMTQAEAAEVLGLSEGTVAWRLSEVRKRLRDIHEREM